MILVSFSSAEDALSNGIKDIFSSEGNENPLFRFLGDTRYKLFPRMQIGPVQRALEHCFGSRGDSSNFQIAHLLIEPALFAFSVTA